ncbi:MAG: insulinase family protein, partial [Muribaculaceae bacterium]|nr:insulinase family protein [Muribaculaceae bacterium]
MFAAGLLTFGFASAQMPQQMPPVPTDTAVTVGKLDNGLTYYIRHNNTPKGQVDFYIAQKVGSILEEENQRGLAHFLEHMCFNGSENFPGNRLIDWLESVGVKFGYNLNAYTDVDETVYRINNVPATRPAVVDSCLLILHDWASALTLDPDEIDSERKVIHEEWRQAMVGEMRLIEKLLPIIYPDNRYGERLPIGTMEVVDNFPYQALVDYYHTWYRPDQQGIVVVGDINPAEIEKKIKEIFGSIKMPENAKERVYYPVDDTPGTIFAIGADPEVRNISFELMFKIDPLLPREYRNTQAYFPIEYMRSMVVS